jgi:hypothetical protein
MKKPAATTWRKRKGSDTWHFVTKCSNWPPVKDGQSRKTKPRSGELCDECLSKQAKALAWHVARLPEKLPKVSWWTRSWQWFFQATEEVP